MSRQISTVDTKLNSRRSERVDHLIKVLSSNGKISSFLDLGCGNAEVTCQIKKQYQIPMVYGADVYDKKDFKSIDNVDINYIQVIDFKINES